MRTRTVLATTVLALATMARSAVAQAPQQKLQPLMDEMMVAANAHDTDRFLAPFLHDSTLVFVFNGMVVNGYAKLRELQYKAWNTPPKTDAVYTSRGPDTYSVLTPNLVMSTTLLASRRTVPETKSADMVVTMLWQLRPDGWHIIQAHESTAR